MGRDQKRTIPRDSLHPDVINTLKPPVCFILPQPKKEQVAATAQCHKYVSVIRPPTSYRLTAAFVYTHTHTHTHLFIHPCGLLSPLFSICALAAPNGYIYPHTHLYKQIDTQETRPTPPVLMATPQQAQKRLMIACKMSFGRLLSAMGRPLSKASPSGSDDIGDCTSGRGLARTPKASRPPLDGLD